MENQNIIHPIYQWNDADELIYLGGGSFGRVFKVQDKITKQIFARKEYFAKFNQDQNQMPADFLNEVDILKKVHYPTIVSLISFSYFPPHIDTQLIGNGSLDSYINASFKGHTPEGWNTTHKFIVILGVALGLQYLHSNNICHRDIKPSNVLLDSKMYPHICDFGMSKVMKDNIQYTFVGSPGFQDPAMILQGGYGGKEADIFSLGMLIYCVFYDTQPFPDAETRQAIFHKLTILDERPPLENEHVPGSIDDLIKKCWDKEPSTRPKIEDIVRFLLTYKNENVIREEVDDFLKFCNESSYLKFPFLQDNLINPNFIRLFEESKNPQVILLYGSFRIGKSSFLNQIINGPYDKEKKIISCLLDYPFIADGGSSHVTNGCELYGPISFKEFSKKYDNNFIIEEDFDIFFVDTEGLYENSKHSPNFLPSLLTLLHVSTISIILQNNGIEERSIEEIINNVDISNFLGYPIQDSYPIIYQNNFILDRKKRKDASFETLFNFYIEENSKAKQKIIDSIHDPNMTEISVFTGSPFVDEFVPKQDNENLILYWKLLKNFVQEGILTKMKEFANKKKNSNDLLENIKARYNFLSQSNLLMEFHDQILFRSVLHQLMVKKFFEISHSIYQQFYQNLVENIPNEFSSMIELVEDQDKIKERIQKLFKSHEFSYYQRMMETDINQFFTDKSTFIQIHLKRRIKKYVKSTIKYLFSQSHLIEKSKPYFNDIKQTYQFREDIPVEYSNEEIFRYFILLNIFY